MANHSANDVTANPDPTVGWTRVCPNCQAKVQPVARGCWQCGAIISEADSEHPDYRPPLVDSEEVSGASISILLGFLYFVPVVLVLWALISIFSWGLF